MEGSKIVLRKSAPTYPHCPTCDVEVIPNGWQHCPWCKTNLVVEIEHARKQRNSVLTASVFANIMTDQIFAGWTL